MALHWDWNEKMGSCTTENEITLNLYRGNAFMIAIHEYEVEGETYYTLAWFAADAEHMKNMLGLTKGYDNCFKNFGITKMKLDTSYKESAQMVQMLAKSKTPMQIELC